MGDDTASIDLALAGLRVKKDCTLRPCRFVSSGFVSIAPHRVGIAHLRLKPRFLLIDPTGCGKTPQALIAYAYLRERDAHLRCLVVTNKSAVYQWEGAVGKFLQHLPVQVIASDTEPQARVSAWRETTAPIVVTNWHTMIRDIDAITSAFDYFVLILDEIQAAKNWRQERFWPIARLLADKARYAWGLTATPMMNRLSELYSIVEIIRPGTFGKWSRFGEAYLIRELKRLRNGRRYWQLNGTQNLEQLQRIVAPFMLGRSAEEIDPHLPLLPPPVIRYSEMTKKQRAAYTQIVNKWFPDMRLAVEGRIIDRLAALTYAQIACDAPAALGLKDVPSIKLDELLPILKDEYPNDKVVIFCRSTKVIAEIAARLTKEHIAHVQITGAETAKARDKAKQVFSAPDGRTQVMLISTAGGSALDLQAARIMIFFDLPWSHGEFRQIIGRIRRIGSAHARLLVLLLINRDSIDEHVLNTLYDKEKLIDAAIAADSRALGDREVGSPAAEEDPTTTLFEAVRLRGVA